MTTVPHSLAGGDFSQSWSDRALISGDDDWSAVPSIVGFRGDEITSVTGADPQTLTGDGTLTVDVNANRSDPNGFNSGGVAEFDQSNPTVALAGSGTADAPNLVVHLDATGRRNVTVAYTLRDLESGPDNAIQAVALQYRIGSSGAWTNVPAAFVADATAGPSLTAPDTRVQATLPAEVNGQAGLQIRVITTNAVGNDEWVGVDDIAVTSQPTGGGPVTPRILGPAESLAGATTAPNGTGTLALTRLGAISASGTGTGAGGAEVVTFDPATDRLFTLNARDAVIDVTAIGSNGTLTRIGSGISLTALPGYGGANTVAVRNGVLAVGYQNADSSQNGAVALFDAASLALIGTPLSVGNLPDQLSFNAVGTKILVANEGERATVNGSPVNPTGSVSLIDLTAGAAAATVSTYDFGSLAGQEDTLRAAGVRLPSGPNAIADIEPEYTTIAGSTAYVTLQEANTVAVFDISGSAPVLTALKPLGTIDHALAGNELDASDDGPATPASIRLRNEPVLGLPMPDAIASFTAADGRVYFITANEGDARSDDSDVARLGTLPLDPTAFPNAAALKANAELGRLNVSTIDGNPDGDGDYDQIYAFGGRGISIFRQETDGTITKVRETGGEFEKIIARDAAAIFNQNQGDGSVDARSDDKGPEPEGVTVGNIAGRTYAFVGLERTGGVMVYDVTVPAEARFVTFQPPASGTTDAGPEVLTFISAADSPTGQALVVFANEVGNTTTVYQAAPALTAIPLIQGTGATSSFAGQTVTTAGVVTAVASNGFYLQDRMGDGNAATSDAVFVFTSSRPSVAVGDGATVTGQVQEFLPSGAARGSFTVTQIGGNPSIAVNTRDNALPGAVRIGGADGLTPPAADLVAGSAFWESLEGMRATVTAPLVTGPTNSFGEIFAVADGGVGATGLNERGNLLISGGTSVLGATNTQGGDLNPERIRIDPGLGVTLPQVNTGARLADVTGVVNYSFGNYEVLATAPVTVATSSLLTKTPGTLTGGAEHLLVASFNAENLDPTDGAARFATIAAEVRTKLNAPDVIALQEVQDNDGPGNTASTVTSATGTLQQLVDAIAADGGPTYAFVDNTFIGDDTNGGEPGGNIRTSFLYRTDRVGLAAGSVRTIAADGSPIAAGSYTDQQTNPDNPFFGSRPPLAADFVFNGQTVTVVSNHFTSKGGSAALFGSEQPPFNAGEVARAAQAQAVNTFVDGLLAADAQARVVVTGDLNDFGFEEPLTVLRGAATLSGYAAGGASAVLTPGGTPVLTDLQDLLPAGQRYDYVFEGNAQTLDHMLTTAALTGAAQFEAVHINADFVDQTSDHDPLLGRFRIAAGGSSGGGGDGTTPPVDNTPSAETGGQVTSATTTSDPAAAEAAAGQALQTLPEGIDLAAVDRAVEVFLAGLQGGTSVNVSTFTPTPGANDIRIEGPTDGTQTLVVLNASAVPPGTPISVNNIGFIALSGPASLVGGEGSQVVFGDNADQSMVLGPDDDTLRGGGGNDLVGSKAGNDLLYGDAGVDTVSGGIGLDTLFGGTEQDLIYGNQDADLIYGNQGADSLYGGQGDDRAFGGQGDDRLFGNLGNDVLYGNQGADMVYGNQGSDLVYGNQGADILFGGQGDDVLYGGQDNDTLVGGIGNDILVGGLGADLYRFDPGSGRDLILGFDQAGGDRIALGGQTYTVGSAQNGDALLTLSGGGVVDLAGIRASQINASYFAP